MRDALFASGDSSTPDDTDHLTLTSREFVALTGVTSERVRTWQRRFGFPSSTPDRRGRRGFFAADVPRVLAVRQMVAAGTPVAEAVRTVTGSPALQLDRDLLADAFGALPTPVVAVSGPAPVELFWANDAALAAAPDGAATALPHALTDRSSMLRHLLVEPPESPVWLAHRPWFTEGDAPQSSDELSTPVRSMAWAYGAPSFVPAILVVVDVPVLEDDATAGDDAPQQAAPSPSPAGPTAREESLAEHAWALAAGAARRALQRSAGRKAIDDALGALVASNVVQDAIVVLPQGDELRAVLSARGRPATTAVSAAACCELRTAVDEDRVVALAPETITEFVDGGDGHAVVAPLVAGRVEVGYLVLTSDEPLAGADAHAALILGFASALAAAITRDRALRTLQRVRGT